MQAVQEARPVRVVFFGDSISEVCCSVVMSHSGIGGQNTYEGGSLDGLEISQPDLVLVALAPFPEPQGDAVFMSLVTEK